MNCYRRSVPMAIVLTATLLTPTSAARGQTSGSEADSGQREQYERVRRLFSISWETDGVYDSNVNHDLDDIDSRGIKTGIDARLYSSARDPLLMLMYQGKLSRFSGTDRWDRFQQELEARLEKELGPLELELMGEVRTRGATEDRELGNQYTVRPRVGVSFGPTRVRFYTAYRLKRFDVTLDETVADFIDVGEAGETVTLEERIGYVGAEIRYRFERGQSVELEYRYEDADADDPDRRFTRQRYSAEYRADLMESSEVRLGLEYRPRRFGERLIESSEGPEPRKDRRWIPFGSLSHTLPWGQELELEYEYQRRTSNDPDEGFESHRITLSVLIPLVDRYRRVPVDGGR